MIALGIFGAMLALVLMLLFAAVVTISIKVERLGGSGIE
jgi:hypothetical protein